MVTKDSLPEAAPGTEWIEKGACFMKDGKTGKVEGNNCVLITVL